MPDTQASLHTGQRRSEMIVPEPEMTRAQALRRIGWIAGIDYTFMFLIAMCFVTLLFWKIFGNPQPFNILACVLAAYGVLQIWIVILIFRCALFVVDLTKIVNLMPEQAAKIVMSAYSGGQQRR